MRDRSSDRPLFARLAEPFNLGGLRARNRFVHAPMSVGYASPDGFVTAAMVEHYARRARGGVGVVITENLAVSAAGRQLPRQPLISNERFLPGLSELAAAIKSHGALAVTQLVHAGRYAGPWDEYERRRRLAPSAVSFELRPGQFVTPQEITIEEIETTIEEFSSAASLARRAGFDAVEIHAAQGFLVSSFQSPRMNVRGDAYGRDRNLFARRVIAGVVRAAGPDMPVGVHLMSSELLPGGWTDADSLAFARELKELGISFVAPVASTFESLRVVGPAALLFDAEYAASTTQAADIPVLANGGLGDPIDAESVLRSGAAAAVALARPLFSDPDLPNKVLSGRAAEIRVSPCAPPMCLATQLTGSVCSSWPDETRRRGFWGMG